MQVRAKNDQNITKTTLRQFTPRSVTVGLEPSIVWEYFEKITQIPRGSGNEKEIGDFIIHIAQTHHLEVMREPIGNVIVRKPASHKQYAKSKMITFQGHLDMVTEKNQNVNHDFTKDPIKLVMKGKYLGASGTTLGADNGVSVAMMLSLMTSKDLTHGPLEFLFTVDEESGFGGVNNLMPTSLRGRTLVNLDSEEIGEFTVGCAGGCEVAGTLPVSFESLVSSVSGDHVGLHLSVTGLKGGHSGVDINLGRANALRIVGRWLTLLARHQGRLISVEGGNKINALPRYAQAKVIVPKHQESGFKQAFNDLALKIAHEHKDTDTEMTIVFEHCEHISEVMSVSDQQKVEQLLNTVPHGVMRMSDDIPGLVETSTNLAYISTTSTIGSTTQKTVVIKTKQRSLVETGRQDIACTVRDAMHAAGVHAVIGEGYPGWKPELSSPVLQAAQKTYERLYGCKPQIKAIHAGLECGKIGERIPGMDMMSCGPTILDAHSPDERVDTESVGVFWKFLTNFLTDIAENQ